MICRNMQYVDPLVIQSRGSIGVDRIREYQNILETFDRMGLDMKNVGTLCEAVPAGKAIFRISHSTGPAGNHHFEQTIELLGAACVAGETNLLWGCDLYDFGFRISYND